MKIIRVMIRGAQSRLAVERDPARDGDTELLSLVQTRLAVDLPPFEPRGPSPMPGACKRVGRTTHHGGSALARGVSATLERHLSPCLSVSSR